MVGMLYWVELSPPEAVFYSTLLSPYLLQENDEYSYEFLTEQGIRYAIYFLDYSFIFSDYPAIAENVFSFNIEVLDGDADISITDERIGVTILEVFNLFFKKLANVAVYVFIPLMLTPLFRVNVTPLLGRWESVK